MICKKHGKWNTSDTLEGIEEDVLDGGRMKYFCDKLAITYRQSIIKAALKKHFLFHRDVLFEYHRAVVPFSCAIIPVRSLSTL